MQHSLFAAACLLLVVLLASAEQHGGRSAALPALSALRGVSNATQASQTGSEAYLRSSAALDEGSDLSFGALDESTAEWSIHCFSLPDPLLSASVSLTAPTGGAYIAVADYGSGRWELQGPFAASQTLELDNVLHRSPADDLFIAVIASRAGTLLHSITVSSDTPGGGDAIYFDDSFGVDMGLGVDAEIVNGNPALACFDDTNFRLLYVRAADATGTAWQTPVYPDPGSGSGDNPSLAVVDGHPAIAYELHDGLSTFLYYVRAGNPAGSAWGTPQLLTLTGTAGYNPELSVVNGRPAVTYLSSDLTNHELFYMRASDASGSSWGSPQSLATDVALGEHALLVVDGNPAVAFFDRENGKLSYRRALDAQGSSWDDAILIDSMVNEGHSLDLAVVNGNPALCYNAAESAELRYVRAADATGTGWGSPQLINSGMDSGAFCSLAYIGGQPLVAYFRGDVFWDLMLIRGSDSDGSAWGSPELLDGSSDDAGFGISLLEVSGQPAVAWYAIDKGLVGYLRGF